MKRILIDTHVLIWWLSNPSKLSSHHLKLISNPENTVLVSIASFWEICLKVRTGKLIFQLEFQEILNGNDFSLLSIEPRHLEILLKENFPNKDPFDNLLMAQAISEKLEVISYDTSFKHKEKISFC